MKQPKLKGNRESYPPDFGTQLGLLTLCLTDTPGDTLFYYRCVFYIYLYLSSIHGLNQIFACFSSLNVAHACRSMLLGSSGEDIHPASSGAC